MMPIHSLNKNRNAGTAHAGHPEKVPGTAPDGSGDLCIFAERTLRTMFANKTEGSLSKTESFIRLPFLFRTAVSRIACYFIEDVAGCTGKKRKAR